MTTQTALKAQIASDLDRTDLTTYIGTAITSAIRYYQSKRFYFNESRTETFATVAAQSLYSSSDDTAIPNFYELDSIVLDDGSQVAALDPMTPDEWELATGSGTESGRPTHYTRFNQSIGFWPIPDAAYTIRMVGHYEVAAPASDGEANNVWMTEAFDLIRYRVLAMLWVIPLRKPDMAQALRALEIDEFSRLSIETAAKTGTGEITPTEF